MPKPKRHLLSTASETTTPPPSITPTQSFAQVLQASGNNLYTCTLPSQEIILVELPARFRNAIWIKRGSYALVDMKDADVRRNKIQGEIVNVVREEKVWRRESYWPVEFGKKEVYEGGEDDDGEEDESMVGKMPPVVDEEDEEP